LFLILRVTFDKPMGDGQSGVIVICLISMPAFGVKASIQLPNPVGVIQIAFADTQNGLRPDSAEANAMASARSSFHLSGFPG